MIIESLIIENSRISNTIVKSESGVMWVISGFCGEVVPPLDTPWTLDQTCKGRGPNYCISLSLDSDYSTASAKISKKQKIAQLTFNQRVKPTRFLSKSNNNRKTVDSKTPKTSQVKKISSSQSRKTLEMNSNEEEYLNNVDLNTDSILNDKSIKW